jgi:uncharacterized protein (DUF58 family)
MAAPSSTFRFLPATLADAIQRLGIRVRRPVRGRGEGLHRSPDFGASVEFADYRAYVPGDPPNRIDWPVYARTDRTLIRRSIEETSLRATLLLDASASMAFRQEGPMAKFDYARFLAAGLAYALVRQGDSAALVPFAGASPLRVPPAASVTGLRPLLEGLESLEPAGRADIGAELSAAAERIPSRSLVVILSDFLQEASALARGLRRLDHDGHNLLLLHVTDAAERRLAFHGVADLRDMETGRRLVVDADDVARAYAVAADKHLDALRRAASDALGEHFLFDTREPVADALRRVGSSPA